MTCQEAEPLLNAYLDRELDLTSGLVVERHLAECTMCAHRYSLLQKLQNEIAEADLAYASPPRLAARILSQQRKAGKPFWWNAVWQRMPVLAAVSALLVLVFMVPFRDGGSFENELIDGHMRSLIPGHLVDVPSSDRHTVKPWFQGRINFSPAVPDLGADGFPLIGGRLDVVGQRQAAVLVYKRREHLINLFIVAGESPGQQKQIRGYNVVAWKQSGMSYWAVSDLNAQELQQFATLIQR